MTEQTKTDLGKIREMLEQRLFELEEGISVDSDSTLSERESLQRMRRETEALLSA